jgi:hypothetical protein
MSKGSASAAKNQVGIDRSFAETNKTRSGDAYGKLFPFLTDEMTNPMGFGDKGLADLNAISGQATSSQLGAGNENANLAAARTGNTASLPAVIAANSRNAMKTGSDNALNVGLQNELLKEKQRQSGAAGIGDLYDEGTKAALEASGLVNKDIGAWTEGKKQANADMWQSINGIRGIASGPMSMLGGSV